MVHRGGVFFLARFWEVFLLWWFLGEEEEERRRRWVEGRCEGVEGLCLDTDRWLGADNRFLGVEDLLFVDNLSAGE